VIAGYYPTLSLSAGYYIGQGPQMPGELNHLMGFWTDFSSIGLNLKILFSSGFETRSKVRQADIQLRTIKEDLIDTKLSLDLAYANAKTQINNSIITIQNQKKTHN
jgi:outer membrane protein TolC